MLWLIGSKLAGVLKSIVEAMQWLSVPNNAYYHTTSQLCVHASSMHALACACMPVLYGMGIDIRSIVLHLHIQELSYIKIQRRLNCTDS